jgi:hypothetical protein
MAVKLCYKFVMPLSTMEKGKKAERLKVPQAEEVIIIIILKMINVPI